MSKYGRKLYICRKKETPPTQKIIHNHLQNCPNFRGLPPIARFYFHNTYKIVLIQNSYYKKIYFDDSNFLCYVKIFYYMIFTGNSAGKILVCKIV